MLERLVFPLAAISAFLLLFFSVLVASKKLWRSRREYVSKRRRARYTALLRDGSDADLVALAHEVSRRRTAQEDLAVILGHQPQRPSGDRRSCFQHAIRAIGLDEQLVSGLGSRSAIKRGRAALLTARMQLPGAVPALERLLYDPDPDVQQAALSGIAASRSKEAAWALVRGLRGAAMAPEWIVDRLGHAWAVDVLLTACHSAEFRPIRAWLAEALGLAGDARARDTLAALLLDGEDEERVRACRALGRIGCGIEAECVIEALGDSFWPVRAQAARALVGVEDEQVLDQLVEGLADPSWWVRANCAEALRSTPRGVVALKRALDHQDRFARDRAAEALALEGAAPRSRT